MKAPVDDRLAALRGSAKRRPYNARSLAALENNPRCTLRALLDASGSDKAAIAEHAGYPSPSASPPSPSPAATPSRRW